MATAAEHLAGYGVSVEQAREFIFANLGNLGYILAVADDYGVTNAMLGEIVGGYSGAEVQAYFSAHGLDSSILEPPDDEPPEDPPYDPYYAPPQMAVELTGQAPAEPA